MPYPESMVRLIEAFAKMPGVGSRTAERFAFYVLSAPQAGAWIFEERHARLGLALLVTAAFWLLYVVAALGYELRVPTATLRLSSASLLSRSPPWFQISVAPAFLSGSISLTWRS